jgi:hypothetical protein
MLLMARQASGAENDDPLDIQVRTLLIQISLQDVQTAQPAAIDLNAALMLALCCVLRG